MTKGSTNAVALLVASSASSNNARTKEITAEARRMRTSWSLNCSRINSHNGVEGSSGNSVIQARRVNERDREQDKIQGTNRSCHRSQRSCLRVLKRDQ